MTAWQDIKSIPANVYVDLLFPNGLVLVGAYLNFPKPSWGVEIDGLLVALTYTLGEERAPKPVKWKYRKEDFEL